MNRKSKNVLRNEEEKLCSVSIIKFTWKSSAMKNTVEKRNETETENRINDVHGLRHLIILCYLVNITKAPFNDTFIILVTFPITNPIQKVQCFFVCIFIKKKNENNNNIFVFSVQIHNNNHLQFKHEYKCAQILFSKRKIGSFRKLKVVFVRLNRHQTFFLLFLLLFFFVRVKWIIH